MNRHGKLTAAIVVAASTTAWAGSGPITVPGDHATIQAAIDAAPSGSTIIVAPGYYNELIDFGGKAVMVLSSDGASSTVIDATGLGGSVVKCVTGEGDGTVLRGFTLTGGTGTDFEGTPHGGGMFVLNASPKVEECVFIGNTASDGGGMFNVTNSNPDITGCTFLANTTTNDGAGMMNRDGSSPLIIDCTFANNRCVGPPPNTGDGAGMVNRINSSPTLIDCVFFGNRIDSGPTRVGGGMLNVDNSNPTLMRCFFGGNSAQGGSTNRGGAMFNQGSSPMLNQCGFSNNDSGYGGAIANIFGSTPTLNECSIMSNTATFDGGGIYSEEGSETTVSNSYICNNVRNNVAGPINSSDLLSCPACPGDLDLDGMVGINDFLILLAAWGPCP